MIIFPTPVAHPLIDAVEPLIGDTMVTSYGGEWRNSKKRHPTLHWIRLSLCRLHDRRQVLIVSQGHYTRLHRPKVPCSVLILARISFLLILGQTNTIFLCSQGPNTKISIRRLCWKLCHIPNHGTSAESEGDKVSQPENILLGVFHNYDSVGCWVTYLQSSSPLQWYKQTLLRKHSKGSRVDK